jgi:hypothetical protein
MSSTVESLRLDIVHLREQLRRKEEELERRERMLRAVERGIGVIVRRRHLRLRLRLKKLFTPMELRPATPTTGKRKSVWDQSGRLGPEEDVEMRKGIPFNPEGLRGKREIVGLKVGGVLWEVGIGGVTAALEELGVVICDGSRWLVGDEEREKRKGVRKTSSTVVTMLRGVDDADRLTKRGLWIGGDGTRSEDTWRWRQPRRRDRGVF